jgi:hypothetical protein
MVAAEGDPSDKSSKPRRFGKAFALVHIKGNIVGCYVMGNPAELVQLESDCFKWAEAIVRDNPSTTIEKMRETSPF